MLFNEEQSQDVSKRLENLADAIRSTLLGKSEFLQCNNGFG